jgi:hypothetical protein
MLFSKAFSAFIEPNLDAAYLDLLKIDERLGATQIPVPPLHPDELRSDRFIARAVRKAESVLSPEAGKELRNEVLTTINRFCKKHQATERGQFPLRASASRYEDRTKGVQSGKQKYVLTDTSEFAKLTADMKIAPQWPPLKKRLQKATEAIGVKPALAKVLNVDPTQISQWLSESKSAREPSGDYALRLEKWVEKWESQNQQPKFES